MLEPHNRTEEILVAESEEAQFDESDFSTLEEFEKLDYKTMFNMSGKLSDIRFRRNTKGISKDQAFRFRSRGSSRFSSRGDYKIEMVDAETRLDITGVISGFAALYKKPKQTRKNRVLDDELKQMWMFLLKKYHDRTYIA